jgi:magnesium chelatase family protein
MSSERSLIAMSLFRALHHFTSDAGLIGGGIMTEPGKVSLTHSIVLLQRL